MSQVEIFFQRPLIYREANYVANYVLDKILL